MSKLFIPDKSNDTNTTSFKFKGELWSFCQFIKRDVAVELGTNRGYTTHILAQLFKKVYTFDIERPNIHPINAEFSNIIYKTQNIYRKPPEISEKADLVFIDAKHEAEYVKKDLLVALEMIHEDGYIILHDLGIAAGVQKIYNKFVEDKKIATIRRIGMPPESSYRDRSLFDYEAVIIQKRDEYKHPDTICLNCIHHQEILEEHRCMHDKVTRKPTLDYVTGQSVYGEERSLEPDPLCQDINKHGDCEYFTNIE